MSYYIVGRLQRWCDPRPLAFWCSGPIWLKAEARSALQHVRSCWVFPGLKYRIEKRKPSKEDSP